LILLAGRFKGKRVVFLKQLTSGLLLITGPYGANGVPLRRVNQRYVIATSTKVALDGVNVADVDDAFFARDKKTDGTGASAERKSKQDKVDAPLLANIAKVEMLGAYIKSKFSLRNGDKPYLMKF
jgi:large subunit ribosomal protein L6e